MCGIVGYVGFDPATPILLKGLEKLEYRGYDSAGVAVYDEKDGLRIEKAKGKLRVLCEKLHDGKDVNGTIGIRAGRPMAPPAISTPIRRSAITGSSPLYTMGLSRII